MTVYLDLIILDNFAADFALLYLAVKTARGEVKLWRLALTALAIAVGAFLAYMFALAGLLTALFSDPQIEEGGGALTYTIGGVPSGVLVACTVLFVAAAKKTVAKIAKRKKILSLVVDCSLFYRENRVRTRAFLDRARRHVRGGGGKSARR